MKQFGKKKIIACVAAAAVLAAAVLGGIAFQNGKSVAVEKAAAVREAFEDTYTVSGNVSFGDSSMVISEVTGRIEETPVSLNQRVEAGDVLMRIDPSEYEYQRAQAAAQSAGYSAQLSQAKISHLMTASPGEYLSNLQGGLTAAKDALSAAETQYNAAQQLYEAGGASKVELDSAKAAYDQAKLAYDTANAGYEKSSSVKDSLEKQGITEANINEQFYKSEEAQLGALISAQNTVVSHLDDLIAKCTITAPAAGTVAQLPLAGVTLASAGQVVCVVVPDGSSVTVEGDVLTSIAPYVKADGPAEISLDLRGGKLVCSGRVSQVYDYAVEDVSPLGLKEYKVHVVVTPDDPSQLASMSGYEADLKLQLFRGSDVLTVPSEAVFESGGEYFMFTVRDGKAVKTAVEVGYQSPQKTVILSGLSEGEEIVARAETEGVYDGAAVRWK